MSKTIQVLCLLAVVLIVAGCRNVPVKAEPEFEEYIPPVMRSRIMMEPVNPHIKEYIIWKIEQDRKKREKERKCGK